jgi:hypothetical protein
MFGLRAGVSAAGGQKNQEGADVVTSCSRGHRKRPVCYRPGRERNSYVFTGDRALPELHFQGFTE